MTQKLIYFTDLQIHDYKQYNLDGSRLGNCLNVLDDIADAAVEHNADFVLFGGDLVDQQKHIKKVVSNQTQMRLKSAIDRSPCTWVCISGNHDHETKNLRNFKAVSFLDALPLSMGGKFYCLDRVQNCNFSMRGGITIYGIEYFEYKEDFEYELDKKANLAKKDKNFKVLMIHQTPEGIHGMAIADTNPYDPLYENFDLVLCGHIHQKQWLTDKFLVGGSPIHRDLADLGQENGYWVFTIDNEIKTFESKFVSLNGKYPIFTFEATKQNDFVLQKPKEIKGGITIKLDRSTPDDFRSDLTPQELIKNYWKEVDGKNKSLLETGLKCLVNV